jgi:hypothetical protein
MGNALTNFCVCAKKIYKLYELTEKIEDNYKCERCFERKPTHKLVHYDSTCEIICKKCSDEI